MIDGIRVEKDDDSTLCTFEYLSDQFKNIIRRNLVNICNGRQKADTMPDVFTYQYTLDDFFQRFSTKAPATQIGMIGELLSHLLLIELNKQLTSVNPYYNMEERSIKKGFDLVLFDFNLSNKMWITEVKSGEMGSHTLSNDKNKSLLNIAKSDLKKRLNTRADNVWHNAMNGAYVAMTESDRKNAVIKILANSLVESRTDHITSAGHNVILTSVLFGNINDPIDISTVSEFCCDTEVECLFNDLMVISIHKGTISKVIDFLKSEVDK